MMTISEMKERKKDLCYTNEDIAVKSGLPLSTVQKVFCGATKNPRYSTLEALELVLKRPTRFYEDAEDGKVICVRESAVMDYKAENGQLRSPGRKVDCWTGVEPSEKWPRQGEYTIADVEALPDDVRVELIDGYIYELATPSAPHQRLVGYLYSEFSRHIENSEKPCEVFVAPSAVTWENDNKTLVEPDVQIRCLENETDAEEPEVKTRLVIEILSPSTRLNDCTIKLRKYMTAGIEEYWIIDIEKEIIMVYLFYEDPFPAQYSFNDSVPVGISGGHCSIDFYSIKERLENASRMFGDKW